MTNLKVLDLPPQKLIPDSIKILHREYKVETRDPMQVISDGRQAEINYMTGTISYLPMPGPDIVESLVHECLHGIGHAMDLELTEKQEEHIVSVFGIGITTIMVDNPNLFPSLQKMLVK